MRYIFLKGVLAINILILLPNIVSGDDVLLNEEDMFNDIPPHNVESPERLQHSEGEDFDNNDDVGSFKTEINEFSDDKGEEIANNQEYFQDTNIHNIEGKEAHTSNSKELYEDDQQTNKDTDTLLEDDNSEQSDIEVDDENERSNILDGEPDVYNVPLREILLKLKPEGLTDEDEEPTSDIPVLDMPSTEQVESEEESLSSSGLAEGDTSNSNSSNTTDNNETANVKNYNSKKAACLEMNITESIGDVEIINASTLLKLLQGDSDINSRSTAARCHIIYFFSPYCPFSVMGSAYVNALARSLPNIPVYGMDSIEHHSVNARYGVMGTPTLLLFHNGNGAGRYNSSEYSVSSLMSFVQYYTDQDISSINVTTHDFRLTSNSPNIISPKATLPSEIKSTRGYALWAAWIFMLTCCSWMFVTSHLCARLTEAVLNNWREAEAQHDHQD